MLEKEPLIPKDLAYPIIEISCNHSYKNLITAINSSKSKFTEEYLKLIWHIQKYHSRVPEITNPFGYHFTTMNSTSVFTQIMSVDHEKENPYYQYIDSMLNNVYEEIEKIRAEYEEKCKTSSIDANKLIQECHMHLFSVERDTLHNLYTRSKAHERTGHMWFARIAIDAYKRYWGCNRGIWISRADFINTYDFLVKRLGGFIYSSQQTDKS